MYEPTPSLIASLSFTHTLTFHLSSTDRLIPTFTDLSLPLWNLARFEACRSSLWNCLLFSFSSCLNRFSKSFSFDQCRQCVNKRPWSYHVPRAARRQWLEVNDTMDRRFRVAFVSRQWCARPRWRLDERFPRTLVNVTVDVTVTIWGDEYSGIRVMEHNYTRRKPIVTEVSQSLVSSA